MIRVQRIFICGLFFLLPMYSSCWWFARDGAACKAQQEDWNASRDALQKLVIDRPDDASILYDLGVATYKLKEHDQASAYFESAAQYATNTALKERAYFNHGNTLVQQKKLYEAIDAYEKVLEINPDNEQAQHNLEVVKKMLENQEQQQDDQQQKQDQQDQDNQNKEDKDQQQDDQNQKDDGNQDQSGKGDSESDQQEDSEQDEQHDDRDAEQDKEQKNDRENGDSEQESDQDDESQDQTGEDARNEPQQKDSDNKGESERGDHDESPEDGDDQNGSPENDTQEQEKEQEASGVEQGINDTFKELDAHLAQMLEAQEKKDADLSKQIIKMQVNKQLAGQDGQNRW